VAEIARAQTPGRRIVDLFENMLSGKPINRDDLLGVAQEVFWTIGGGMAGGYHPPVEPRGQTNHAGHATNPPWGGWPWGRVGQQTRRPPQAVDSNIDEIRRARQVMGFAESEPLDEGTVTQRRKTLARKHHPDLGGSLERMAAINNAADVLLANL
jgi:hypothetical protein